MGTSTVTDYNAVDENDEVHRVMMEVEPLLEASGKRNWRSIMSTHDEFPCHCLLQTCWYHYWKLRESVIGGASCRHMMSSSAIACYKHVGTPGVVTWC